MGSWKFSGSGIRIYCLYCEDNQCPRYFCKKTRKGNFYHEILLGILSFKSEWAVISNRKSGNVFSDFMICIDDEDIGIIIEVKYADENMETVCLEVLNQININQYAKNLCQAGIRTILKYGIACNRKSCRVLLEKEKVTDLQPIE